MTDMDIKRIPAKGYVYACGEHRDILFDTYEVKDKKILLSSGRLFSEPDFDEYHFFSETEEYRAVTVNGQKRFFLLTEAEEKDDPEQMIYREEQYLKDEYCTDGKQLKLIVVSRFGYTENDSLYLRGYRLAGVIR